MNQVIAIVATLAGPLVIFWIARYWQKQSEQAQYEKKTQDAEQDERDDTKKTEQTTITINDSIQKQRDAMSKWGGEP